MCWKMSVSEMQVILQVCGNSVIEFFTVLNFLTSFHGKNFEKQ